MQKNNYAGKFIAIEGLDGSGQSTQVQLLSDFLIKNGHSVVSTKEPTKDSEAGKKIRQILNKNTSENTPVKPVYFQELFAQDRGEHLEKLVVPALREGKIVISDRYCFTSFAYGMAEGVDLDYLIKINENFLMPDLTIILKVSPAVCLKRIEERGSKKEFFERMDHFSRAVKNFEILPERFDNVYIIDGERPIDGVHQNIKALVKDYGLAHTI